MIQRTTPVGGASTVRTSKGSANIIVTHCTLRPRIKATPWEGRRIGNGQKNVSGPSASGDHETV